MRHYTRDSGTQHMKMIAFCISVALVVFSSSVLVHGHRYHSMRDDFRAKTGDIGRCAAKMPQFFRTRISHGPVQPNPRLTNMETIVLDITTQPNFARSTKLEDFLEVYEVEMGFTRWQTLRYIRRAIKFHKEFWGLDFMDFQPEELLNTGVLSKYDGKVRLVTTTFSKSSQGATCPIKAYSDSSSTFCRTFKREPISTSGAYIFISGNVTSDNNIKFVDGDVLFHYNYYIPHCGIRLLNELTQQSINREDPLRPGVLLDAGLYDIIIFNADNREVGQGRNFGVRTIDTNKGQQEGQEVITWDVEPKRW